MPRNNIFRLRAAARHKSIAVGESVRGAPVRTTKRSRFNIAFNSTRDRTRLVCISAEATNAERIDGETLKRDYALQVRIEIRSAKARAIAQYSLIEARIDAD